MGPESTRGRPSGGPAPSGGDGRALGSHGRRGLGADLRRAHPGQPATSQAPQSVLCAVWGAPSPAPLGVGTLSGIDCRVAPPPRSASSLAAPGEAGVIICVIIPF